MTDLRGLQQQHVDTGEIPGAVALVARRGHVEVEAVGTLALGGPPMTRDAVFRVASITKPIVAAAAMQLVDEGRMVLDDPIARWLPELAEPRVVRTPGAGVDDVVPAHRPVTVEHVLSSRAGWGFPADFSLPAVQLLMATVHAHLLEPALVAPPDAWVAELAQVPLLHQPGEGWLYNTAYDLLGVLVARVAGRPLAEVMAERLFAPLGMRDTGFAVPAGARDRTTTSYRPTDDGTLELVDPPQGHWSTPPAFASGAGGLVSTADDWFAFGRMLLAEGVADDGRRVLSREAVRAMTTDCLTPDQREAGRLFLEGQGWGYGGSVDVVASDPWTVPGRYGWVGGTGTAAHVVPATGAVTILLTQRELTGPASPPLMQAFWAYAASA